MADFGKLTTRREPMTELHVTTTSGTSLVLDAATVQGFKTSLRGPLLHPRDAGYDDARTVWNGMIDRHPALIASEHPDLFWGLRGGGGNFGVVTSFEYQLHPVGPVLAGIVLYPFTKAKEALTFYRDFATAIPDEVNTIGALLTSPDGAPVVAIGVCYNGDLDAGEK